MLLILLQKISMPGTTRFQKLYQQNIAWWNSDTLDVVFLHQKGAHWESLTEAELNGKRI
jgi:hypothetical protein